MASREAMLAAAALAVLLAPALVGLEIRELSNDNALSDVRPEAANVVPDLTSNVGQFGTGSSGLRPPKALLKRWTTELVQACLEADGSAHVIEPPYFTAELNGDGIKDFVLQGDRVDCTGVGALYGNAGPPNSFVISSARTGYRLVDGFSAPLSTSNIQREDDRDVIVIEGERYAAAGVITKVVWGFDGEEMVVVRRENKDGIAVDEDGAALQEDVLDDSIDYN